MSIDSYLPPFDVSIENRPGVFDEPDVTVIIRTPVGSFQLVVNATGNTLLVFDPSPGLADVAQTVLFDRNAPDVRAASC